MQYLHNMQKISEPTIIFTRMLSALQWITVTHNAMCLTFPFQKNKWTDSDCFTITLFFYSFFSAFLFSCRSEVSKSLEIDTILRNFTVFEYLKDKVRPTTYHAPLSLSVSNAPLRWHQHTQSVGSLVSLPCLTTLLCSFDPEVCRARSRAECFTLVPQCVCI